MILRTLLAATVLAVTAHAADFDRTLTVSGPADLYVATGSGHIHVFPGSDNQIHIHANLSAGNWNFGGGNPEDRIRQIAANPPIRQAGATVHVGDVDPDQRSLYNNISIDYEISAPRSVALNLHTGSGDIEIDNLGRFLKADTGSGSIRAHGIAGQSDLHTGSGDVELQEAAQGDVKATTGSGSIRISGLNGGLNAHTGSGDIEAGGHLAGPAHLQSGSGSIRIHIGHDAHYNLDAATGSGSIRTPGNDNSDSHHINRPINGGGPTLEVHTGSGDIEVN